MHLLQVALHHPEDQDHLLPAWWLAHDLRLAWTSLHLLSTLAVTGVTVLECLLLHVSLSVAWAEAAAVGAKPTERWTMESCVEPQHLAWDALEIRFLHTC